MGRSIDNGLCPGAYAPGYGPERRAKNGSALKRYWDLRSRNYHVHAGIDQGVYNGIVDYLYREGIFQPGDTVLDIGCGPGTYSLSFAKAAESVTGIDISPGMLSKMMEKAEKENVSNIRPVCSSWERYGNAGKFDLAFSSLCPGINDAGTLLKMEGCSKRSCCCITSCSDRSLPTGQLWERLTGERLQYDPADSLYLFNVLYYSDRSPSLRLFKYEAEVCISEEKLVERFIAYFKAYMDVDRYKIATIKDHIASISTDGVYTSVGEDTLCVIHWNV